MNKGAGLRLCSLSSCYWTISKCGEIQHLDHAEKNLQVWWYYWFE